MVDYKPIIIGLFISFHVLEIITRNFWSRGRVRSDDVWIEVIGTAFFMVIAIPFIFYAAPLLTELVAPGSKNTWSDLSWWQMLLLLLLIDEGLHYWWHRACHEYPLLYNLHRAHHSCQYMSVRLAYRNNIFYFLLMPSVWASAVLIHLGLGPVYAIYIIVKMGINFSSHSPLRWDAWMYKYPILHKPLWLLERIITTPAAHSAHHGLHKEDGITHYKGNYANLLFLWDVVFGTAKLARRYPAEYGIENIDPKSWKHEMFWPLIREDDQKELMKTKMFH